MNYSTAIFLINDKVRAIAAIYDPERYGDTPTIFKTLDPSIKEGDFVIVPTTTRHSMTVVKVVNDNVDIDFDTGKHIDWVIQKVDAEPYGVLLAQEDVVIEEIKSAEKRKRREEMRQAVFANQQEKLKALPLADLSGADTNSTT